MVGWLSLELLATRAMWSANLVNWILNPAYMWSMFLTGFKAVHELLSPSNYSPYPTGEHALKMANMLHTGFSSNT